MCRSLRDSVAVAAVFIVALALLVVSPAQAGLSRQMLQSVPMDFPPGCKCDRNSSASPYSLDLVSTRRRLDLPYVEHCFRVAKRNVLLCDTKNKCCGDGQGVNKVELEANFGCKGALKRVTVNGELYSAWEFNKVGVVRVTGLNRNATTSNGTTVCLLLAASEDTCSRLDAFCTMGGNACKYALFQTDRSCCPVGEAALLTPPPFEPAIRVPPPPNAVPFSVPPPPPPRTPFPNCTCVKDPAASQVFVRDGITSEPAEKNLTKLCFELGTKATCDLNDSPCCRFTVHKVELEADVKCATALSYMSIDGIIKPRSFQYNPYPAIKFSGINRMFADAAGTKLCLFMKPDCNTVEALGLFHDGTITATVFNNPAELDNCCPTNIVNDN